MDLPRYVSVLTESAVALKERPLQKLLDDILERHAQAKSGNVALASFQGELYFHSMHRSYRDNQGILATYRLHYLTPGLTVPMLEYVNQYNQLEREYMAPIRNLLKAATHKTKCSADLLFLLEDICLPLLESYSNWSTLLARQESPTLHDTDKQLLFKQHQTAITQIQILQMDALLAGEVWPVPLIPF
jgi:hypothetical protein